MSQRKRKPIDRREFLTYTTGAALGAAAGVSASRAAAQPPDPAKILNHNPDMEYRRLGKTGLWVSAVCLGGHWKRLQAAEGTSGWDLPGEQAMKALIANRAEVISKCIDVGINYVDACAGGEIMAYAEALRGRREKMYFGFSWYESELRFPDWRTKEKLIEGFDNGLRQAKLGYADVWRVSALMTEPQPDADMEAMMEAFEVLHGQGKVRFLGLSSHHHEFLKHAIETWPQISVILFPYTANSKELPQDSLFDAIRAQDVGAFGIKPFSSNSLFKGNSQLDSPVANEDDELARLTIRYILGNPAITAPIPGLINTHQVENVALAVREHRKLDLGEQARLRQAVEEMTANLPPDYHFLRDWEWV
ncbi:MAG: aldo/keto reductase [Armatimonadetes bacterium]|nr:aldo/keto reductase [Armatimonadota bacterium]